MSKNILDKYKTFAFFAINFNNLKKMAVFVPFVELRFV